jgi:hypothetical protein
MHHVGDELAPSAAQAWWTSDFAIKKALNLKLIGCFGITHRAHRPLLS